MGDFFIISRRSKGFLQRKPFQPFIIEWDDGDRKLVEKPEALMYLEGRTGIYFGSDGELVFVDCDGVRQFIEANAAPLA